MANSARTIVTAEIDFTKRSLQETLERAKDLIVEGYRILRDEVGADNPADNAFLREARVCAIAKVVWTGERGGADARTADDKEVEIKSTRLDQRPSIQFPTSRYVSPTVIARFREATFWLFGVFDVYEELVAVYRVEASAMQGQIDELERRMKHREGQGLALENNPKLRFSVIRPKATLLFLHSDFEEYQHLKRGTSIRPR